ncbi:hypothetical protein [Sphingobacterium faecium]|uniref:hypothetical protein n=1 Tax=Sphingobacterium faecium TaxID=34087 RepID=UPI00320A2507
MDQDLLQMERKLAHLHAKDRKTIETDYGKVKAKIASIREVVQQKNIAFDNDMQNLDERAEKENESFKRDVKKDMDDLEKSLKSLNDGEKNKSSDLL